MKHIRSAFCLLALPLFLSSATVAQAGYQRTIELPATGFVPAARGDYTRSARQHALLLHDNHAWLWYAPARHSTVTMLASDWFVNDVATLPGTASDPMDRILGIGSGGLSMGRHDANLVFSWSVLSLANWQDGVAVKCFGNADAALVVGLSANRTSLGVGVISGGAFVSDLWVSQGVTVQQFALLDWDGDGDMEVAVLTSTDLRILDATLTPIAVVPTGGGAIATLRNKDGADDLAWVQPGTRGGYNLMVVSALGISTPVHLTLALAQPIGTTDAFPLVGIAAADSNGDGRADVAIVQNATSEIVVLYRQATGAPFVLPTAQAPQTGKVEAYDSAPGAAGTLTSMPLFGDFTADKRDDFVLTRGNSGSHQSAQEGSGSDGPVFFTDFKFDTDDSQQLTGFRLKVRFVIPSNTKHTHLHLLVWHEKAILGSSTNYSPQENAIVKNPYQNTYHELTVDQEQAYTYLEVWVDMVRPEIDQTVWRYQPPGGNWLQPHLFIEASYFDPVDMVDTSSLTCCGATLRNMENESVNEVTLADAPETYPFMSRLLICPGQSEGPARPIRGRVDVIGGIVPVIGLPLSKDGSTLEMPRAGLPTVGDAPTTYAPN